MDREPVMRDDPADDDEDKEDAHGLAGQHYLAPPCRPHDLAHVDDVDGQVPGEPERVGDRQDKQRRIVGHVRERPDEHPGQQRGRDQGLAPADLVGQPAEGVAADQDADPDLQGVQDVVLAVIDDLGRQPDERVQPQGDPVGRGRARPADLHDQADLPGHQALGQAVNAGRHLAGNDQRAARRRPRLLSCLVPLRFSLLPQGSGVAGKAERQRLGRCRGRLPERAADVEEYPGSQSAMPVIKRGLRRVRQRQTERGGIRRHCPCRGE